MMFVAHMNQSSETLYVMCQGFLLWTPLIWIMFYQNQVYKKSFEFLGYVNKID